jgi:hypothetical protein
MKNDIQVGTLLIAEGTELPESLRVATESYSAGWSTMIHSTSAQLRKAIEAAGWTFFYMAGEIRASGLGFTDQSRTARAMAFVIEEVKRQNCNCLEITQVKRQSFWGLPYTTLAAHPRHIQSSSSFHDRSSSLPSGRSPRPPVVTGEWLYDLAPAAAAQAVPAPAGALPSLTSR